jgi:hypothetical protein
MVYDPSTGAIGLAKDYKYDATITLYNPSGDVVRTCTLKGCWPSSINHGPITYDSGDPIQIEVTIRYDVAEWA